MTSILKKYLPTIMAVAAVISFVGAILVLAIPVARADVPYKQVLGIIIAVFMFLLAALLAVYLWLNRDTEPNFFLFDRVNNIDDIAEYRGALVDYVKVSCKNMLYDKMKTVLKTVATSPVFETLRQNFDDLVEYSRELKASIVSCEKNPDWDKEYDKMIPTDFFFRNIAEVTPEQAFQMSLLNMFAANEEWMVEKGMLVDGKLKVYTGTAVENVRNLLSLIA